MAIIVRNENEKDIEVAEWIDESWLDLWEGAKKREKTRNVIYGWRPKGKERNRDTLICMTLNRKQSTFCLHVIEKWLSSTLLLTINTVGME